MTDNDVVLDFLEHFGVMGMHWGVRKEGKKSLTKEEKREVRAKKYDVKAKEARTKYEEARTSRSAFKYDKMNKARKQEERAIQNAKLKREGKLSVGQKRVVVGASTAAALLAAYGTYHSLESGNARRLMAKGKAFVTKDQNLPWKKDMSLADPNLSAKEIYSKVVRPINPDYGEFGTKMNCRRATYAYEMRRRGEDVTATRSIVGKGQEITGTYNATHPGVNLVPPGAKGVMTRVLFESQKQNKPFTKEFEIANKLGTAQIPSLPGSVFKHLKEMPDGARGEVEMLWNGGGGHSMAWEKIKGRAIIFDTQNGRVYDGEDVFKSISQNMAKVGINRLDNLPLNNDFLMRWVKSAK